MGFGFTFGLETTLGFGFGLATTAGDAVGFGLGLTVTGARVSTFGAEAGFEMMVGLALLASGFEFIGGCSILAISGTESEAWPRGAALPGFRHFAGLSAHAST